MDKHLQQCLEGSFDHKYLFPFFWQHGEDHEILAREMDAIYDAGIRQFCIESRTHADFGKDAWWTDMGFMLDYARKKGMKVWLLDDKCFPTGYANGYIEEHPELRKVSFRIEYRDFGGVGRRQAMLTPPIDEDESFIAVVAYKLNEDGSLLTGEPVRLEVGEDGLVRACFDGGVWRVCYIIRSHRAGRTNYIDMISRESCAAMIKGVYKPVWDHFSEYFGTTFLGFFSDEPCFSNWPGSYESVIGITDMPLPYREDMVDRLAEAMGVSSEEALLMLPHLWLRGDGRMSLMRDAYMDVITRLYSECFTYQIGDWCRAHGVEYVGHVIEDSGAHMRLGVGPGHFFRALDGQDMAGIDVVLNQIIPGITDAVHAAHVGGYVVDPKFFNYLLAKLGSSHAHIDAKKRGRAMCEIFGAFGWAEGLPCMKRLADHMLVNGINYYVPHAFTPKHNDPDCPPHFYNAGDNTQYALFGQLSEYMQRMCHLISDGRHTADVAVFYSAEAEWSGEPAMLPEEVTRALTRGQIDFDLVPTDALCLMRTDRDGLLCLNGEKYKALIVPRSDTLPEVVLKELQRLSTVANVIFADALPRACSGGSSAAPWVAGCTVLPLDTLADTLRAEGLAQITLSETLPLVRFYHYERDDSHVFLFMNENEAAPADFTVDLPGGDYALYDAVNNRLFRAETSENGLRVRLAPGALIALVSHVEGDLPAADDGTGTVESACEWFAISAKDHGESGYTDLGLLPLGDLTETKPEFCGRIRYEFTLPAREGRVFLDLGEVGETAELWINGEYAGFCYTNPYSFEVTGRLTRETNTVRVEVCNNQAYRLRDRFSGFMTIPASGMLGPVTLRTRG